MIAPDEHDYIERLTRAVDASVQFSSDFKNELYQLNGAQFHEMFAQEILFHKPIELVKGQVRGEAILVTYDADDLRRMINTGIIPADQLVELIDGHLFNTPDRSSRQITAELDLGTAMLQALGDDAMMLGGYHLELGAKFSVAPPIAVVQAPRERYEHRAPSIGDVYLIAEVIEHPSNHSNLKIAAYARACVPEIWVLNLATQQLEVYADSDGEQFQHRTTLKRGQLIAPLEFPDAEIRWW